MREKLAANFSAWTGAIEECLVAAADRLPVEIDRKALSQFVLSTMEGGVMQARTHRSLGPFDASVGQLRHYFDCLAATAGTHRPGPLESKEQPSAKSPHSTTTTNNSGSQ